MHSSSEQDEIISFINVTPLVDVLLVILIIFIVTASLVLKNSIPVDLPKAQSAEQMSAGLLNVAITREGAVYVNGKAMALEQLPSAVAKARVAMRNRKQPLSAFISADVKAPYGQFAKVMDKLRLEGITDIALDTNPSDLLRVGP
jgi:biopolymer transport protein ExbD